MFKWYCIFKDHPDREAPLGADISRRAIADKFKAAGEAGGLYGNELSGMWLINADTAEADVVQIWGTVPDRILQRFRAWQNRQRLAECK